MKNLALAICILAASTAFASEGTRGGGDSTAQWAKAKIVKRFGDLQEAYGAAITVSGRKIDLDKIASLVENTRVRMVKGPLLKNGKPVEALNYPAQNLIELDEAKFEKASRLRLLIHEVLGLVQIEDNTYKYSSELERESELLSPPMGKFPFGTAFVDAHRAWAQASFKSVAEAEAMITNRTFNCSWISWAGIGTGMRLDPNQWSTRPDVQPEVRSSNNPLGRTISIGMNSLFRRGSGGPAKLENGKVITMFVMNGDAVKASAGNLNGKLILKVRDARYSTSMDFETVNVCE